MRCYTSPASHYVWVQCCRRVPLSSRRCETLTLLSLGRDLHVVTQLTKKRDNRNGRMTDAVTPTPASTCTCICIGICAGAWTGGLWWARKEATTPRRRQLGAPKRWSRSHPRITLPSARPTGEVRIYDRAASSAISLLSALPLHKVSSCQGLRFHLGHWAGRLPKPPPPI